jgi:uncharacterized membrane-anchored protein YjiN (DUF445 family)
MSSRAETKDRQLRRMKLWASALLLLMFCLYVLSSLFESQHPALFYLSAFTEAAMVGAIADWFAVVALFHHPFGLRFIPHTAIVPRNKGRIAEGVADFIQNNFLSPEAIVARIAEARPARTLCAWLLKPQNADAVAGYATRLLAYGLTVFDDARIRRFLTEIISTRAKQVDLAGAMAEVLEVLTQNGRHHELLDAALAGLDDLLARPQTRAGIAAEIAKQAPLLKTISDWLGLKLDERAALKLVELAIAKVAEVRRDRGHELRQRFDAYVSGFVRRLKADEATRARVHALRDEVLANPALGRYLEGLWGDFRAWLSADLQEQASTVRRRITQVVGSFANKLDQDVEVQRWLDEQILAAVPTLVREHRAKISRFVEDQINGWQESRLVQELERELGPDLQYIRINGTLVGGLAGLFIAGLAHFMRVSV